MSRAVIRSLGARGRAGGAPHNPQQWGGCGVDGLEVPAWPQPVSLHPSGAWEAPALQDHEQLSSSTEFSVGGGTMLLEMVSPHAHISTRSQPWVLGCLLGAEHKKWRNWGKASEKKNAFLLTSPDLLRGQGTASKKEPRCFLVCTGRLAKCRFAIPNCTFVTGRMPSLQSPWHKIHAVKREVGAPK